MNQGQAVDSPYPGLRPFTEAEVRYYSGRDTQRNECIQRLENNRFLAIVGSSGAGKSSLVNAGILPEIKLGRVRRTDENWRIAMLRPGPDPMTALARELAKHGGDTTPREVDTILRTSPRGLAEVAERLSRNDADPHSLLVLVDQFEELFRLGTEQQTPQRWFKERAAFVRAITSTRGMPQAPVYVLITMRSDFLQNCTQFPGLPDALNEGIYLMPQLTLEQLEAALTKPLEQVEFIEAKMSVPLLRRILKDAAELQDALPVVQHSMMRTWLEWRKRVPNGSGDTPESELGLVDYDAAGTTVGAINRHGNEVLSELEHELGQERAQGLTKLLFQRLTLTDADGKVTRSPKSFQHLVDLANSRSIEDAERGLRRVIEAFRRDDCRFLVPPDERIEKDTAIDISHEAVFREWSLLAGEKVADVRQGGWIHDEYECGRTYARLIDVARLRSKGKGQLLTDEFLAHTVGWWDSFNPNAEWASRYHVLDEDAEKILKNAKSKLDETERGDAFGPDQSATRDATYEEYRREFKAWHEKQFGRAKQLLEASRHAKQMADDERKRAEDTIRAAELARRDAEIARQKADAAEQREEAAEQRAQAEIQKVEAAKQREAAAEQRAQAEIQKAEAAKQREALAEQRVKAAKRESAWQNRWMRLVTLVAVGGAIVMVVLAVQGRQLSLTEEAEAAAVARLEKAIQQEEQARKQVKQAQAEEATAQANLAKVKQDAEEEKLRAEQARRQKETATAEAESVKVQLQQSKVSLGSAQAELQATRGQVRQTREEFDAAREQARLQAEEHAKAEADLRKMVDELNRANQELQDIARKKNLAQRTLDLLQSATERKKTPPRSSADATKSSN